MRTAFARTLGLFSDLANVRHLAARRSAQVGRVPPRLATSRSRSQTRGAGPPDGRCLPSRPGPSPARRIDHCRSLPGAGVDSVHRQLPLNHVQVIVAGDREPKEIREPFKAWCTRRLKALQQERLHPLSAHDSSAAAIRQKWWAERGNQHSMSTTRKALRRSSTTYARHKIMQINLNPTSERAASRDAVNRPRETLGDSHLISSDPGSRFGLVCDLLCCRGNKSLLRYGLPA